MSLISYKSVKGSSLKFSVLSNEDDYVIDSFTKEYPTVPRPSALCRYVGTNFCDFFLNAPINEYVDWVTFETGEKLQVKITSRSTSNFGNTSKSIVECYVNFYFINKNGSSTTIGGFSSLCCGWGNNGEPLQNNEIFLSVAVDDESKRGFLVLSYNSLYEGAGDYATRDAGTRMVRIYTDDLSAIYYDLFVQTGAVFDPDPWSDSGYSSIGGGEGTFKFSGDIIGLPDISTVSTVSTGFLQLFNGSLAEIKSLSAYMWSDDFLDNIVKITQNPMNIVMSLYMYPFPIPSTQRKRVQSGNVLTPVSMSVPDSQIIEVKCGEVEVPHFYGAYLDYEPYTKCEIFLPYCGMQTLSLDDIMGKTVEIRYRIDLLTGVCCAYLIIEGSVLYSFSGLCAVSIPLTGNDFANTLSAYLGIASSSLTFLTADALSPSLVNDASSVATNVMQSKPRVVRSGNTSGNAGFMGVQKPYFVFTVPKIALPKEMNKYNGYPNYTSVKLNDISGYTEVAEIHLNGLGRATSGEIERIEKLLKGGVIL